MIRNIIFDMGQVLIYFRHDVFIDRLEIPQEERPALLREVFNSVEWVQLDRGTATEEEATTSICRRLPQRLHGYVHELVFSWWQRPLLPVDGMEELIRELKEMGYGIYLLSNASGRLHQYFSRIPASKYFDGMIVSADWKLLKPQHEIYETLFRQYQLRPEECFFVDDLLLNVEGARYVGMDGTIFRDDVPRLRRELNQAGVPVKL